MPPQDEPAERRSETVEFGSASRPPSRIGQALRRLWSSLASRRRSSIAVVSTLLLAAVVLTGVAVGAGGEDKGRQGSATPQRPDSAGDGTGEGESTLDHGKPLPARPGKVWVGDRGIMLEVPSPWVQTDITGCNAAPDKAVTYPDGPRSECPRSAARSGSSVTFVHQAEAPIIISPLLPIGQTSAGALLATRLLESSGVYIRYIVYPARDMYAVIRSPNRNAVQQIALSARELPVEYVVVPELRDLTPKGALAEIKETGLVGRVAHNSGIVLPRLLDVVNQTPARGLVVAEGSRVMVSVIPADPPG